MNNIQRLDILFCILSQTEWEKEYTNELVEALMGVDING